jgi:hypothetical protein
VLVDDAGDSLHVALFGAIDPFSSGAIVNFVAVQAY